LTEDRTVPDKDDTDNTTVLPGVEPNDTGEHTITFGVYQGSGLNENNKELYETTEDVVVSGCPITDDGGLLGSVVGSVDVFGSLENFSGADGPRRTRERVGASAALRHAPRTRRPGERPPARAQTSAPGPEKSGRGALVCARRGERATRSELLVDRRVAVEHPPRRPAQRRDGLHLGAVQRDVRGSQVGPLVLRRARPGDRDHPAGEMPRQHH